MHNAPRRARNHIVSPDLSSRGTPTFVGLRLPASSAQLPLSPQVTVTCPWQPWFVRSASLCSHHDSCRVISRHPQRYTAYFLDAEQSENSRPRRRARWRRQTRRALDSDPRCIASDASGWRRRQVEYRHTAFRDALDPPEIEKNERRRLDEVLGQVQGRRT
jgi:hypothetical protein